MSDTWRTLIDAAKTEKILQVRLAPGARVFKPKKPVGRPRRRGATRYGHYLGYRPDEGGRPRCRLPGCTNYLKVNQAIACCADHRKECLEEARTLIEMASRDEETRPDGT